MTYYNIFPYKPDFPILESLEWLTDVLEVRKGQEQRIKIRKYPRKILEWKVSLDESIECTRLRALIAGEQHSEFLLPLWEQNYEGDNSLFVNTSYGSGEVYLNISGECEDTSFYYSGEYVCLYEDSRIFDVCKIDSIISGEMELAEELQNNYSEPFYIMPAKRAYLLQEVPYKTYLDDSQTMSLAWTLSLNYGIKPLDLDTQYKSKDVLVEAYDVDSDAIEKTSDRSLSVIDNNTGAFKVFSRMEWSRQRIDAISFFIKGRTDIWNFKRWLHKISGKWKSFWLPNHQFEIRPVNSITQQELEIQYIGYAQYLKDSPLFQNLMFLKYDGSFEFREIVDATWDTYESETLYLDSDIEENVEDIRYICFIGLYRLDTDRVELNWESNDEVNVKFPVIGVEA